MASRKTTTTEDVEAVEAQDLNPETETAPSKEKAVEADGFIPIDEASNFCSNCQDRLHFDYIANLPVCPISHPKCPRNGA